MLIQCPENHVIIPRSGLFGRMGITRCIEEDEFIGCQNDVLFLIDRWCSGRRQCDIAIPNPELKAANTQCRRYLQKYINVDYHCLQGYSLKSSSESYFYISMPIMDITDMHVRTHTHTHTHIQTHTQTPYIYIYIYIYNRHTNTHKYIYIYIYIYIYAIIVIII